MFVCTECGSSQSAGGHCAQDGTALAPIGDDVLLGATIGAYRVARLLGVGGMGRVYKGVHPTIGSRVAIKVLSRECSDRRDLVERFFAEAKAVNLIRHESIVNVLDLSVLPDGRPYIIMEYLDGSPLSAIIEHAVQTRQPLPLGGLARLAVEVLDALGAAHGKGIVHRDLKPDNIFVTPSGRPKVLDFGIAKLDESPMSSATRTGSLLGTPHYMSPEQAAGRPVDHRADIYAIGVILFECATGQKPFVADSLFDLLRKHVESPAPSPRLLRPDLDGPFEQVVLTALEKHPDRRFASAQAMSMALQGATSSLSTVSWTPITGSGSHRANPSGGWQPTPPASWGGNSRAARESVQPPNLHPAPGSAVAGAYTTANQGASGPRAGQHGPHGSHGSHGQPGPHVPQAQPMQGASGQPAGQHGPHAPHAQLVQGASGPHAGQQGPQGQHGQYGSHASAGSGNPRSDEYALSNRANVDAFGHRTTATADPRQLPDPRAAKPSRRGIWLGLGGLLLVGGAVAAGVVATRGEPSVASSAAATGADGETAPPGESGATNGAGEDGEHRDDGTGGGSAGRTITAPDTADVDRIQDEMLRDALRQLEAMDLSTMPPEIKKQLQAYKDLQKLPASQRAAKLREMQKQLAEGLTKQSGNLDGIPTGTGLAESPAPGAPTPSSKPPTQVHPTTPPGYTPTMPTPPARAAWIESRDLGFPGNFDPKRLDVAAFVRFAMTEAKQAVPDAELTRIDVDNVAPDGTANLQLPSHASDHGSIVVRFRSPSRMKPDPSLPKGVRQKHSCEFRVEAEPDGAEIRPLDGFPCDKAEPVNAPRCAPVQLWKRALAKRAPSGAVANLSYRKVGASPKWYFDVGSGFDVIFSSIFDDGC